MNAATDAIERLKDLSTASAVINQCRVDTLNALTEKFKELAMTPKEIVMLMKGHRMPEHEIEGIACRLGFCVKSLLREIQTA